jgi:casein kinase 1
MPASTRTWE